MSGGAPETTNNRMELEAVIQGLATLTRSCQVELYSDSTYVGKGMSEWMVNWKKNQWRRREKGRWKPIKNEEQWRQLDALMQKHQVNFHWVAGHSGHAENERCDELAVGAYQKYL